MWQKRFASVMCFSSSVMCVSLSEAAEAEARLTEPTERFYEFWF
jgi:hypothetical protein